MTQAAQKSYGKKGQDVVEMNWKAIDAGVDAIHKVDVYKRQPQPMQSRGDTAITNLYSFAGLLSRLLVCAGACLLYTSSCV